MFFNNKFNTFFGLNLTLVYTFPMCMAWRFHFPIRNYDCKESYGQKIWFWVAIFYLCKLTTFAYLDCSIFLICCSWWVWESFPTNKVDVAILSRSNHRLLGLKCLQQRTVEENNIAVCLQGNKRKNIRTDESMKWRKRQCCPS